GVSGGPGRVPPLLPAGQQRIRGHEYPEETQPPHEHAEDFGASRVQQSGFRTWTCQTMTLGTMNSLTTAPTASRLLIVPRRKVFRLAWIPQAGVSCSGRLKRDGYNTCPKSWPIDQTPHALRVASADRRSVRGAATSCYCVGSV